MGLKRHDKTILIALYGITPINLYADYSGRHFDSSSADFLLVLAFIVIVVVAILLLVSDIGKKSVQSKNTVTPQQAHNYIPKVDIKNSTLSILSVSSLEKQAKRSSYLRSFISNYSNYTNKQKEEIQKILNKGACDAAREPNGHLESDSEMNSQFFIYSSKEQEELIKNSKKCKRRFYSPPLNYSIYYDLAYDTVISDAAIRYKISHDIETGLIQCE